MIRNILILILSIEILAEDPNWPDPRPDPRDKRPKLAKCSLDPTGIYGRPDLDPTGIYGRPDLDPTGIYGKPNLDPTGIYSGGKRMRWLPGFLDSCVVR